MRDYSCVRRLIVVAAFWLALVLYALVFVRVCGPLRILAFIAMMPPMGFWMLLPVAKGSWPGTWPGMIVVCAGYWIGIFVCLWRFLSRKSYFAFYAACVLACAGVGGTFFGQEDKLWLVVPLGDDRVPFGDDRVHNQ